MHIIFIISSNPGAVKPVLHVLDSLLTSISRALSYQNPGKQRDMVSPADLDAEHLEPFRRALLNLLSSPVAEFTFAQIVDGQPTSSVYAEDHYFREGLAVMHHENLCPGSIEKTRAFRSGFDIHDLKFEANASCVPVKHGVLQLRLTCIK